MTQDDNSCVSYADIVEHQGVSVMSHERMAPRWPEGSRPRHFFGVSFPAAVFTTEVGTRFGTSVDFTSARNGGRPNCGGVSDLRSLASMVCAPNR